MTGSPTIQAQTQFVSRAQLAARWGCSISTLKRLEKQESSELVPAKFGPRIVRYPIDLIEAIEKAGATVP